MITFFILRKTKRSPPKINDFIKYENCHQNRPSEFLFLQVTQQMRLLDINHYKPQGAREWNVTGAAGFTDEAF